MKKYLFLFLVFLFSSCVPSEETTVNKELAIRELKEGTLSFVEAYDLMVHYNIHEGKFTSEGHRYKLFRIGYNKTAVMSTPHDPECPKCFEIFD